MLDETARQTGRPYAGIRALTGQEFIKPGSSSGYAGVRAPTGGGHYYDDYRRNGQPVHSLRLRFQIGWFNFPNQVVNFPYRVV